ncbi:Protease inhibitor Inh [Ensifer adhaerens]|nr:Protease inhibitor Inh [Ensifer adhaerens]HZG27464.1 AprI/Inh family metalloprotease inhibitor [Ensifer sp.]
MRVVHAVTGIALLAALAGCDRTSDAYQQQPSATFTPAPVNPQPVEGVQSSGLSDPTGQQPMTPGQFPAPPQSPAQTQVASAGAAGTPPANAMDIKKDQMVGGWKVSAAGTSCNMFLTLTKFGNASRGGTSRCVGELTTMRAWDVSGKQVTLMDSTGNQIGKLFKTSDNQYSGSTNSGTQISITR